MKRIWAAVILLCSGTILFGLEVSRAELDTTADRYIRFVNYEGPRSKIETVEEIRGIGVYLARAMTAGPGPFRYYGRYAVIHAVDEDARDALSADIFTVLSESQIDHIDNLRLMVAGFLQEAYGYGLSDALLLGEFITIYNAVHRGDSDYFRGRYIPRVQNYLNDEAAGLSNIYSDWPGGTQMLIPLTVVAGRGRLSSLDGQELTDDAVTEHLRSRDDRGVEERKALVDLQERALDEDEELLNGEREEVREERRQVEEERSAVEREIAAVAAQQDEIARADIPPDDRAEERRRIEDRKEDLERREQEINRQEEEVGQREERIARQEEDLVQRRTAVREDREEIARDQQVLLDERQTESATAAGPVAAAQPRELLFLEVIEGLDEPLARLIAIEGTNGARLRASRINTIRGRAYHPIGDRIVVLAGRTGGAGAVRLVQLDGRSLQVVQESREDIFPESVVVVTEDSVYALAARGDGWALARFDRDLNLMASSDIALNPYSHLVFDDDTVFVQTRSGAITSLRADDLRQVTP